MKNAFIVLPNQLLKKPPPKSAGSVVLIEHPRYFSDFRFHAKKLMFHRASMKAYQSLLQKKKYDVLYVEHQMLFKKKSLADWLRQKKITSISLYDPVDHDLQNQLEKDFSKAGIDYEFLENPLFICSTDYLKEYFTDKKHYSMNSFYIAQRKRFDILIDNGKPRGGQWSFDTQNREKLKQKVKIPSIQFPKTNADINEAKHYVKTHFPENPGTTDDFFYPVTHTDAKTWLGDFVENRLDQFGSYEDAIAADERFLFHSLLSPLINTGLLIPNEILDAVLSYHQNHSVRLNSLEGFIRQLIGWREFMRAVYLLEGQTQKTSNSWKFKHDLPDAFYDATTGIEPVDRTIRHVLDNAYVHHIERLMILGNFMLLCEIRPDAVYRWFMELFIDAYDWVMVPNVFGMSQYADGGLMTTKPYISSSNYIRKMSDYKSGPWCDIWDSLFWRFIAKHKKIFAANPRMKIMAVRAERMPKNKIQDHIKQADRFLKKLHNRNT